MRKLVNIVLVGILVLGTAVMTSCAEKEYTITAKASTGGFVEASETVAKAGTTISIIAISDAGYVFKGWTVDGESGPISLTYSYNDSAAFVMPAENVTVNATFVKSEKEYTVTVNQSTGGSISAYPTAVTAGLTVSLTATPDEGYVLGHWIVESASGPIRLTSSSGNSAKFYMPAENVTVSAAFIEAPEE